MKKRLQLVPYGPPVAFHSTVRANYQSSGETQNTSYVAAKNTGREALAHTADVSPDAHSAPVEQSCVVARTGPARLCLRPYAETVSAVCARHNIEKYISVFVF